MAVFPGGEATPRQSQAVLWQEALRLHPQCSEQGSAQGDQCEHGSVTGGVAYCRCCSFVFSWRSWLKQKDRKENKKDKKVHISK